MHPFIYFFSYSSNAHWLQTCEAPSINKEEEVSVVFRHKQIGKQLKQHLAPIRDCEEIGIFIQMFRYYLIAITTVKFWVAALVLCFSRGA